MNKLGVYRNIILKNLIDRERWRQSKGCLGTLGGTNVIDKIQNCVSNFLSSRVPLVNIGD